MYKPRGKVASKIFTISAAKVLSHSIENNMPAIKIDIKMQVINNDFFIPDLSH